MKKALQWTGPLSIEQVSSRHAELRTAVQEGTEIAIDLRECTAIDLSGLQLLCAGQRLARRREKHLQIQAIDSAVVTTAAAENGLLRALPCCADCGSTCLWLTAGEPA